MLLEAQGVAFGLIVRSSQGIKLVRLLLRTSVWLVN